MQGDSGQLATSCMSWLSISCEPRQTRTIRVMRSVFRVQTGDRAEWRQNEAEWRQYKQRGPRRSMIVPPGGTLLSDDPSTSAQVSSVPHHILPSTWLGQYTAYSIHVPSRSLKWSKHLDMVQHFFVDYAIYHTITDFYWAWPTMHTEATARHEI